MRNLFFVHTPVQMLIAQQLIHQENYEHNVLLYGYIDSNKHFIDIYNILKIDNLWEQTIYFPNLPACADLTLRRPLSCFRDIIYNIKKLDSILHAYNIDNIFLGDIDNIGYQFLMFYYKNKVCINVYEEGTSHYTYKNRIPHKRRFQKIQQYLLDNLFYRPCFGLKFAKYWYREGDYDHLPIDNRWSIVPGYNNEIYDKRLTITLDFLSDKVREYLSDEIKYVKSKQNIVLLITSKVYEHQDKKLLQERYDAYLNTINDFISDVSKDATIIIKLHPREGEDVADDIKRIAQKYKLDTYFLSKKINIPVEIYLQILKPSEMNVFCNSSGMYNGYMYPKCKINDLIYSFFEHCEYSNIFVDDLKKLYKGLI